MRSRASEDTPVRAPEQTAPLRWHVITCEYPPQTGGVSDYTYEVAAGLAGQGDEVHVWCPAWGGLPPVTEGVTVHRELGAFTPADLRRVGRQLNRYPAPRRILVQWVPHGYGYRSMNLAFCCWLWNRAAFHGDHVEIMVHEAYLRFRAGVLRQNVAAFVHRLMTMALLRAPKQVWVSIPAWERYLRPYALGRLVPVEWLPIPSSIRVADNPGVVNAIRQQYAGAGNLLIGHFGTCGPDVTSLLEPVLMALARESRNETVLLMGAGSEQYREKLVSAQPQLERMVQATGALSAEDLSSHVAACDFFIQPYADGVTSRRTSFMVGLSHGKAIITTSGELSEPFWGETGALELAPAGDEAAFLRSVRRLRTDPAERARLSRAARALYAERFDIFRVITTLRKTAGALENSTCVF